MKFKEHTIKNIHRVYSVQIHIIEKPHERERKSIPVL